MLYKILAVGDVVGGCGVSHLERHLRAVKKLKNIHFTVVNGENAAMVGLTADDEAAQAPERWRGLNLLGFALMEARAELAAG